jgi:glutamyl endopeptidase
VAKTETYTQPAAKSKPKAARVTAGAPLRLRPSFMVETNGGGRVEAVAGFNTAKAMSLGLKGGRVPPHLRGMRLGAAGELAVARPEFTFGDDDRTFIEDTTRLPWRCICQLVIEGVNGREVLGTGWLAGPRTVLTAGHNLLNADPPHQAAKVWVLPGRSGDAVPHGFYSSANFAVHPEWQQDFERTRDIGVVWLDKPIGNELGWFGLGAHDDGMLRGLLVNNAGYPADKPLGTQWFNAGRILDVRPDAITYGLDTEPGQSGSPIFYFDAQMRRIVVAVHVYGETADNLGVRITPGLYDTLATWIR